MRVKTPANYIEATDALMTIWESYHLCRYKYEPPC